MGLLEGTHKDYYQGNDHGGYQFVSLDDIITHFQIAYVGEDKLIPRARRADIAFHAQRALAELSFDTLKSVKSQQIDVPPSLSMVLPHDYVNYTRLSWVDSSGIKHPILSTKHTSNPFQVKQDAGGEYSFPDDYQLLKNHDFSDKLEAPWYHSPFNIDSSGVGSNMTTSSGKLTFNNASHKGWGTIHGKAQAAWQLIDVSNVSFINIKATATSTSATTTLIGGTTYNIPATTVRLGLSTSPGSSDIHIVDNLYHSPTSPNHTLDIFDIDYLEWTAGETGEKELISVNVDDYSEIYVLVTSSAPWADFVAPLGTLTVETDIDNIEVTNAYSSEALQPTSGRAVTSSTASNFKNTTPAENKNVDYEDSIYWPVQGGRYGLDPEHAQVNGSFFIDDRLGKIHFSSNISGKTVILDYISDSLGTDEEMQVPKLAEDAMYKHILYDLLSTRRDVGGARLAHHKKEKFAAVRKAKLRLSNLKIEELTQILRNQSKWIKH